MKIKQRKKNEQTRDIKLIKSKVDAAHTIARVKNDENSMELYNQLKNFLKEIITKSTKAKNATKIHKEINKIQAVWKLLNQETRKKGNGSNSPEGICFSADELNDHFFSAGRQSKDYEVS
ncbi:hypothetical protein WA026_011048 [Henosepilachna vigintioctopunctata]|uniref:Uncharacterized protein n=1 Tax=Henosepilachna vigintioctopunctata TaxID=420089 RepID=A0AAW1U5T4_9CUCU